MPLGLIFGAVNLSGVLLAGVIILGYTQHCIMTWTGAWDGSFSGFGNLIMIAAVILYNTEEQLVCILSRKDLISANKKEKIARENGVGWQEYNID
jgi:hypothetical protein